MEAYRFASEKGQESQATEIKEMEIEWDRSYNSSVRRGRLIRLFESNGLLPEFIERYWPYGATSLGESERRRCLRISDDYDNFLSGNPRETVAGDPVTDIESFEFALEAHLRDFLAKNLEQVEAGLRLHETEGKSAVEFAIEGGRIDILAVDRDGRYVVIELKLSNGRNKALGQLLYYMGWVDRNLGKGQCRGIILANEISDELAIAVSRVSGVTLFKYKMNFSVERAGVF